MNRKYTAQEMRNAAENITRVDVMNGLSCREHCYPLEQEVKAMLRYAAEVVERCGEVKSRWCLVINRLDKTTSIHEDAFYSELKSRVFELNYILHGDAKKER